MYCSMLFQKQLFFYHSYGRKGRIKDDCVMLHKSAFKVIKNWDDALIVNLLSDDNW